MPTAFPKQLTAWLDNAMQRNATIQPQLYEMKRDMALALQSCFTGVEAVEVKTQGACSRGTMSCFELVVQAGGSLFRVIDQSPWLEKARLDLMHKEQLDLLMKDASAQPKSEVDMNTLWMSHCVSPLGGVVYDPISAWGQEMTANLQAFIQAEKLEAIHRKAARSGGGIVQAPGARSKPHRL